MRTKMSKRNGKNHAPILFLAVSMLVLAWWVMRLYRQNQVITKIKSQRGTIYYRWQFSNTGEFLPQAQPPVFDPWNDFIGWLKFRESRYSVREIQFHKNCTDADLRLARDLSTVQQINLAYCYDVSDEGIR